MDRWSSGNELYIAGPVKTIRVEEQIYEFEGDFIYDHDKPLLKERFEFDRQGKRTEDYTYTIDGRESPKTADIYNDKNWLTRQDTYSALTQKPYLETRYSYDRNGNILDAAQYSLDDNKLLQKWSFRYEPSRNYFEITDTDARNKVRTRVGFTKDAQCRTHEISTYQPDGELKTRTTLAFNGKDIPIGAITRSAIGAVLETRKFEYQFDSYGNWIKKSDFAWKDTNGKSAWKRMNVVYRKIEYYD